jgi:hypothetical protein
MTLNFIVVFYGYRHRIPSIIVDYTLQGKVINLQTIQYKELYYEKRRNFLKSPLNQAEQGWGICTVLYLSYMMELINKQTKNSAIKPC